MSDTSAPTPAPAAREVAERFVEAFRSNDWDGAIALYDKDVVLEIPFAPIPELRHNVGRAPSAERFALAREIVRIDAMEGLRIHGTDDPEVVVIEYVLHNRVLASGRTTEHPSILVMRIRDGRIVHSRDYTDPGRNPEVQAALIERNANATRESGNTT